jgi:4-amino-4-deoxy-L-arabinose transferase-like glycosyltransferase
MVALALVAFFDVQTSFPFLDEYARRWTIQRLAAGHGMALWGVSPNLVQVGAALPLAWAHLPPEWWRLSGLPFVAMAGAFSWLSARRLGAGAFWAAIAAAVVALNPMELNLATGMMTETAFVGLLMLACWCGLRVIQEGRGQALCVLALFLLTLQRQQGIGAAVAIAGTLLLVRRAQLSFRLVAWSATMVAAPLLALQVISLFRSQSPATVSAVIPPGIPVLVWVQTTAALSIMLGLLLLPFAVGLLRRPVAEARSTNRLRLIPAGLAVVGLAQAGVATFMQGSQIYPGNIFGVWGLGAGTLTGHKAAVLPLPIFLAVEALTIATFILLLGWRSGLWRPSQLGAGGGMLTAIAISQFAIVLAHGELFDRYFLAMAAPLAPLLAVVVDRGADSARARGWALAMVVLGVAFYAAGEQDYVAWQVARDRAAQLAYAQAPADQVYAGFEESALHLWIPWVDQPGQNLPTQVVAHPRLHLEFAPPGDPRPGFSYNSLAPGRIVVIAGNRPD